MLEKHGVDCESFQVLDEKPTDVVVGRTPGLLKPSQGEEDPIQESLLPAGEDDRKDRTGGMLYGNGQSDYPDAPPSVKLGRTNYFEDCAQVHTAYVTLLGYVSSGVFSITPVNIDSPMSVYCDQTTDGGGWTVIQRRFDGSLEFFRIIDAYREGFGDSSGEYWLGLDNIHRLTAQDAYELYIELEDWEGNVKYARYSTFSVGAGGYHTLRVGGYSGTAGDGFGTDQPTTSYRYQNGAKFSTRYFDQDASSVSSVAELHGGGWWYRGMAYSNLNGPYFRDTDLRSNNNGMGVLWYQFTDDFSYSLKKTKMMVRPTDFSTRLANN
ncbi:angiopoietin-related protein 1-like [Branchiostoma floridae]|uniref:Angiopoietin-related protein 1-like n=1 Tax=Branchiostoma floridae TaxID=7739 RepID=A0A9J7MHE6_BRAFL|nr:angiopoietin-related protein 1-like [Branchiostoma floridae]